MLFTSVLPRQAPELLLSSRFGHNKNALSGASYKNVIQLYSRLISVRLRNQESTRSFPFSESCSHSIIAFPLLSSVRMWSSVRSLNELIRLHFSAGVTGHPNTVICYFNNDHIASFLRILHICRYIFCSQHRNASGICVCRTFSGSSDRSFLPACSHLLALVQFYEKRHKNTTGHY